MEAKIIRESRSYPRAIEEKFIRSLKAVVLECENDIFGFDENKCEVELAKEQHYPVTVNGERKTIAGFGMNEESVIARCENGEEFLMDDTTDWETIEIYRKLLIVLAEGKWA